MHLSGISRGERRITMSSSEKPRLKRVACADIVPGCPFTAQASTEQDLMEKVAAHAAHDHGVAEVTPELAAKVKAAIKTQ
jgi:predicted small metal-binding protein